MAKPEITDADAQGPAETPPPAAPETAAAKAKGRELIDAVVAKLGGAAKLDAVTSYTESITQIQKRPQGEFKVTTKTMYRFPGDVRVERTNQRPDGQSFTFATVLTPTDAFSASQGRSFLGNGSDHCFQPKVAGRSGRYMASYGFMANGPGNQVNGWADEIWVHRFDWSETAASPTKLANSRVRANAGGDAMAINAANPREKNEYGQIVRWYPENDDHADGKFKWDLFCMAGNPSVHKDAYAGSSNINEGNMFNSPDGMMFDSTGLLWIQTDGEDTNEGNFAGQGNNQMLAGDPATGRIERFLTAPKGSEVTGQTWSGDKRTHFVGIQHPDAPFPDGEGKLPRSTIIAIKRDDNVKIG